MIRQYPAGMLLRWIRAVARPPGRVAYTHSVVTGDALEPGLRDWHAPQRNTRGGSAGASVARWVVRQQLHERLDRDSGIVALREPPELARWIACTAATPPEPLAAVVEIELHDIVADVRRPEALRGSSATLRRAWLRPAAPVCTQCAGLFELVSIAGVDNDYVAWSCQRHGQPIDVPQLRTALADRYDIEVKTGVELDAPQR